MLGSTPPPRTTVRAEGWTRPSLPMSRETLMTAELLSPEGEIGARDVVDGAKPRRPRRRPPRSEASRRRAQRAGVLGMALRSEV